MHDGLTDSHGDHRSDEGEISFCSLCHGRRTCPCRGRHIALEESANVNASESVVDSRHAYKSPRSRCDLFCFAKKNMAQFRGVVSWKEKPTESWRRSETVCPRSSFPSSSRTARSASSKV